MTQKIKDAVLHDVIFVPGIGQLKTTLNSNSYKGIQMEFIDLSGCIRLTYKDVVALLPLSNFKVLVMSAPDGA